MKKYLFLAAAFTVAAPGYAQNASSVAIVAAPETQNVVWSGTSLTLELREELTIKRKNLKVGRFCCPLIPGQILWG